MTALRLEGVSKTWPGFSLENISLNIEDGEYLSVLGPTGSGKTLLLETILGFHRPDRGDIYIDNTKINDVKPESREIGYVPQTTALFPHLTVRENIEFSLKIKELDTEAINNRCDETIKLLGLKDLEHRKPNNLSGGEKQKTALARAIVRNPKTLLLDEPLSNVDEEGKRELTESLTRLHKKLKNTIIHVTHDQAEALSHSDRVTILYKGKIEQTGTPTEIYDHPATLNLARFMGIENIFIIDDNTRITFNIEYPPSINSHTKQATHIAIRAENIKIYKKRPEEPTTIRGTITSQTHQGPNITLTINIGLQLKATIPRKEHHDTQLKNGDQIYIHIPQNQTLKF